MVGPIEWRDDCLITTTPAVIFIGLDSLASMAVRGPGSFMTTDCSALHWGWGGGTSPESVKSHNSLGLLTRFKKPYYSAVA